MPKYPVLIPYKQTSDNGLELRHALRSLNYLKGKKNIYIVGDGESWFKNINHLFYNRRANSPYSDVFNKLLYYIDQPDTPDEFWVWQDDIYLTEPQTLKTLYDGELPENGVGMHKRSLQRTREVLLSENKSILNYDIHVPFYATKQRLREIAPTIQSTMRGVPIQWRSYYGNTFNIGGEQYTDAKARTPELLKAPIISTSYYTSELSELFPDISKYEKEEL